MTGNIDLGTDGAETPTTVLRASGKVQVNGSNIRKVTTLFSGNSIQTSALPRNLTDAFGITKTDNPSTTMLATESFLVASNPRESWSYESKTY